MRRSRGAELVLMGGALLATPGAGQRPIVRYPVPESAFVLREFRETPIHRPVDRPAPADPVRQSEGVGKSSPSPPTGGTPIGSC